MKQRCLIITILVTVFFSAIMPHRLMADPAQQKLRKLQLAYILNFTKFITWPPAPSGQQPFTTLTIAVYGSNPFNELLKTLETKTANGLPIKTKTITAMAHVADCQVLIIPQPAKHLLPEILTRLQGKPVVTISTITGFAKAGGTIELLNRNGHVIFAINQASAKEHGLTIPSQVLALAQEVLTKTP